MGWPNDPRPAKSLLVVQKETNEAYPNRDHASDGMIGDVRHQHEQSSDHNAWVIDDHGIPVVRAIDVDAGPGLNPNESHDETGDVVAEAALAALRTHFGLFKLFKTPHPAMRNGAYVIHERQIASHKTKGKLIAYTGDPHTSHPHISVALAQAGYDSTRSFKIVEFAGKQATLRTKLPNLNRLNANRAKNRLAVRKLQRLLNLGPGHNVTVDGVYGKQTAARVKQFKSNHPSIPGHSGWTVGQPTWAALKERKRNLS
jgi:hypothetical protein